MYVQSEYYSPDEYGTDFIDESREPCGAFYGLPRSDWQFGTKELQTDMEVAGWFPDTDLNGRDHKIDRKELARDMINDIANVNFSKKKDYLYYAKRYARGDDNAYFQACKIYEEYVVELESYRRN